MKQLKVKIPKGYSIESVEFIKDTLVINLEKDTVDKNGTVAKIVPIRVVKGL